MSTVSSTPSTSPFTTTSPITTGASAGTTSPAGSESAARRSHPVRRATLTSGVVAAVAATAMAAVADAAGVPLAIDGEVIPLLGFAQMTLVGAVIGGLVAAGLNRWSARPRARLLAFSVVMTVLSCIPSVAYPPDAATKVVLVATHVVAAAIIVPVLARTTRPTRA